MNTKQMRIPFFQKLALLALALGFVILFSDQLMPIANALDQASTDAGLRTPLSLPRGVAQINITPSGFVPTVITVTTGTDVVWRNNTSQIHLLMSGQPFDLLLPLILRNDPSASQTKQQPNHVYLPLVSGNPAGMQATPQPTIRPAVSAPERSGRSPSFGINPRAPLSNGAVFSATLPVGGMFTYTFTTGGDFPYFLATAPQFRGNVIVQTGLPPDPSTVAPPVDPSVPTDIASATSFLYTGNNPIQTGVAANTIDAKRVAVIRGKVLTRDGAPLSGVRITILSHPEFGQTLSREDGMFDLASNGGGLLTFDYQKDGYLPVQRKNNVPWRDFAWLPDVVMIPVDSRTTTMRLPSSGMQVARGSVVSDKSGTRQATLYVPPGTQATLILPGGVTQTMTTFHVRITEFTEGDTGPKAMPGELPPQSGYTYAVDYTMDEAVVAGALNVTFSQPLIHYSENFLGFPVGMNVPTGYYDRVQGQWVASPNGKVIKIVSIINGMANLDTTGSGAIDNGAALGVTDAERQMLASLYASGQILWRVPVSHFSPWDCNWPYGPPDDATAPKQPPPGDPPLPDPCPKDGSIIGCESQTLGETVAIAGTPFRLSYSSQRMPGRKENLSLRIPLSGSTIPASLKRIDLEVYVAVQVYTSTFAAAPNLSTSYTWDGKDAYGRTLQGSQPINVRIGYVYDAVYRTQAELENAFSNFGNAITGVRVRDEVTVWQEWQGTIGGWDSRPVGLGGWEMDVHHAYSPNDGVLYLGDGSQSSAQGISIYSITTVAGNGEYGYNGDGIPATQARLYGPSRVAVGPDGSLYIADGGNHRIRRVGPDGIITTVAGNGEQGYNGDGIPATQARLSHPFGVAVGPDGSLYIADWNNHRIRRLKAELPGFGQNSVLIPSDDGSEVYHFSGNGRHLRTLDALTGAVRYQFTYDSAERLNQVTDGDGNVTTIEHDSNGKPTAIVAPFGQRTTLQVDANGYLSRITNPASEAMQLVSTAHGLLTKMTDPRGNVYQYTYDSLGRLTRDDNPVGGYKTLSRVETSAGYKVTVSTALGRQTTYQIERLAVGGVRRTVTDPSGGITIAVYRNDGTIQTTYPDGTQATLTTGPDPRWGMLAPIETSLVINTPGGIVSTRIMTRTATLANADDPFSLTAMTDTVTFNGATYISQYTAATRTVNNTSPAGRHSSAILDSHGRVTQVASDGEDSTSFTYDSQGRLQKVQRGVRSTTYNYNSAGKIASQTDAEANQTQYSYDAVGRLTQTRLPSNSLYRFGYDADGNLTQVTMPSNSAHNLTYTAVDQRATYTPPGGSAYSWIYDKDKELTRADLPGSVSQTYTLDAGGRSTGTSYPGASTSFAYSDVTNRVTVISHTATLGGTQSINLTYAGENVTAVNWSGVATGQYAYSHGNDLLLKGITLDTNPQIVIARDADGLVTQYGSFAFTRNGPRGAITQISDGKLTATYGYNTLGNFSGRSSSVAGNSLYQEQLTYDNVGRIKQKVETVLGVTRTYNYTFDASGQLLTVRRDGTSVEQYGYDANGNRTSRKFGTNPADTASYDSQDRLVQQGSVTYQFNAAGYLTQRGSDTFQYSVRGELVQATVGGQTVTYSYDGLGRRVGRTDASGTYQYLYGNPDNLLQITATRDPASVRTILYYDEGGRLLAFQRGGTWYYVASDYIGTPRVVSDANGTAVKSLEYDGFGRVLSDSNPTFDLPIGFAGGVVDKVTGLMRFGFRDYDPEAGRWTARDPVLFDGHQGNLYVYASNNPIQLVDPWGLFSFDASGCVGVCFGVKLGITSEGFSWCGELGFGEGASIGVDPLGELDKAGSSFNVEATAKVAFFRGKLKLEKKPDCLRWTSRLGDKIGPEFCAGPFCTGGDNLKVKGKPGNLLKGVGDLFKGFGVGLQFREVYRNCVRW